MHGDTGGEDQREGSKSSIHGVEKVNQELDIMTMCHTENNEALKIFVVSSEKDIVVLSLGANNLSFGVEGTNPAWALLVALSYYYVFDQSFCTAYWQILYLMQCFILGDMMESKGKLSLEANMVLMWMNTHKSNPKYSKGLIPIRQSLEPELQDNTSTSTSTSSTELHVSIDGASTSTSMITACTANLSSSTIGYSDGEGCLIDLDFGDGNSNTEKGKGKSSNGVLIRDKLLNLNSVSGDILLMKKVSTPLSARMMTSISPMGN